MVQYINLRANFVPKGVGYVFLKEEFDGKGRIMPLDCTLMYIPLLEGSSVLWRKIHII